MASTPDKSPIIYKIGSQDERSATWLELFFDLIFVAALGQLAGRYASGLGFGDIPGFLLLFIPIWWSWVGQAFYNTRFEAQDKWQRVFVLLQMFVICVMSAFIPKGLEEASAGFALCYGLIRAILIIQYCRTWWHLPNVRPLLNIYISGFTLALSLWILSIFVPAPYKFGLWILAICLDIVTPFAAGKLQEKFPPHLNHIPERFGLFTIIVLGESMVALINALTKSKISQSALIIGALGFLLTALIWWQYFEIAAAAESRPMKGEEEVKKFQLWLYSHLPLSLSVVALAIITKRGVNIDWLDPISFELNFIWCSFNTIVLLSLIAIQLSNPVKLYPATIRKKSIERYMIVGAMFLSGFLTLIVPLSMFTIFLITLTCHVLQIISAKNNLKVSDEKHSS